MTTTKQLRVRESLYELQDAYRKGNKKPLEDLMRAWKGIKELPVNDPRSFFMLGGFHGEPFRGAGWGNNSFWGGYCNHGNVLFPTWHRVYLYKLEEALQSIKGCENVMIPYWDETSTESLKDGIPWALTVADFVLDGQTIPNPLRSFVFPVQITDNISSDQGTYTKPKGYETVRYPYTGLAGTPAIYEASKKTNSKWTYDDAVKLLNQNVTGWLNQTVVFQPGTSPQEIGVHKEFERCLNAPNYTVFSNTTSAQQWNDDYDPSYFDGTPPQSYFDKLVMPLEQPHNDIHLSVGGFDIPPATGLSPNISGPDFSPNGIANGDMGENDTAALDPIFYFHHCNIDRMFWLWQKKWKSTDHLEIIPGYPGTNSTDNQGATPGIPDNSWLTLETPLNPFAKSENGKMFTSLDCVNIEKQLGYTYSKGSLDNEGLEKMMLAAIPEGNSKKHLRVSGINKAPINGSFLITAYINLDGKKYSLGTHSVLSRWAIKGCANCQTHLEVKAHFSLGHFPEKVLEKATYHIEINGREHSKEKLAAVVSTQQYRLEIK